MLYSEGPSKHPGVLELTWSFVARLTQKAAHVHTLHFKDAAIHHYRRAKSKINQSRVKLSLSGRTLSREYNGT